jgi:copper homeostasis protein
MSKSLLFELCADSLSSAQAAQEGGADRLELCEQLEIDGLTPAPALLAAVLRSVSIPVHVLIRPRGGNFVYSPAEFALMRDQVLQAKSAGAAGVVIGMLHADGRVDVARTRELAELARPMKVTFHRAFDKASHQESALEDVIRVGADSLLTSGGAPNVLLGADQLGRLHRQAGNRLEIMAGGGLRLHNLGEVMRRSGVTSLHGSLAARGASSGTESSDARLVGNIREAIRLMQQECLEPAS